MSVSESDTERMCIMKEIFEKYAAGEITLEEVNEQLKPFGLSLSHRTEEELEAQRAEEQKGEFLDIGREPLRLPDRPDMKRRKELAGMTVIQKTKTGNYAVTYDEDGYAKVAKRVTVEG